MRNALAPVLGFVGTPICAYRFTCTQSDTAIDPAFISSCSRTRTVLPRPSVCVCVLVLQRAWPQQTHIQTCSSWQIKMNSVVLGSGSPFIIFHFTQRASQTSAAACHVKTLYQVLTAPPMHTPHARLIHTLVALTPPPTDTSAYAGSICSDLSH